MEGLYTILGVLIGSAITLFVSYKDRKIRKEITSLEIEHKKKLFEIEITQKHELFKLERKDKFRLTAIEKRLNAHQEAFDHWSRLSKIFHDANTKENQDIIKNAKEFWYSNTIYLEKETRRRFFEVINIVEDYELNLRMIRNEENEVHKEEYKKQLKEDYLKIRTLPDIILSEVELEPFSFKENDQDPFEKDKTQL